MEKNSQRASWFWRASITHCLFFNAAVLSLAFALQGKEDWVNVFFYFVDTFSRETLWKMLTFGIFFGALFGPFVKFKADGAIQRSEIFKYAYKGAIVCALLGITIPVLAEFAGILVLVCWASSEALHSGSNPSWFLIAVASILSMFTVRIDDWIRFTLLSNDEKP